MEAWILSIVGVVCLGVLLEIVLPEGQTTKYVKGAFSLLVIFVIAAPLPKFLNKDWKFELDDGSFGLDDAFIEETVDMQEKIIAADMRDYLAVNGYSSSIEIKLKANSLTEIEKVHIVLELDVTQIGDAVEHRDKATELILAKYRFKSSALTVETMEADPPGDS